jgi:dynein heavy chain
MSAEISEKSMNLLKEAMEALDCLNKSSITEMRSFKSPPQVVIKVAEALMILLGCEPTWTTAQKVMSKSRYFSLKY